MTIIIIFNSFSAGIVFRRHNLTSIDVRFWRLKTIPALKGLQLTWKLPLSVCQEFSFRENKYRAIFYLQEQTVDHEADDSPYGSGHRPFDNRSRLYSVVLFLYYHIKHHLLNTLTKQRDINQQALKIISLYFVKSESFSLTWSSGSRQRDTTSSGWKLQFNNLVAKGLIR